jgi:hypothetical protein
MRIDAARAARVFLYSIKSRPGMTRNCVRIFFGTIAHGQSTTDNHERHIMRENKCINFSFCNFRMRRKPKDGSPYITRELSPGMYRIDLIIPGVIEIVLVDVHCHPCDNYYMQIGGINSLERFAIVTIMDIGNAKMVGPKDARINVHGSIVYQEKRQTKGGESCRR